MHGCVTGARRLETDVHQDSRLLLLKQEPAQQTAAEAG